MNRYGTGTERPTSPGTGCTSSCRYTYRISAFALLALTTLLAGCDAGPKPIRYGRDECAECKMTLVDPHYGAEHITARGRVYVFDDVNCLTAFQRRPAQQPATGARAVVVDFKHAGRLLPVDQAWFLLHDGLRSPMASGLAAFSAEADLEGVRRELGGGGRVLRWAGVEALSP